MNTTILFKNIRSIANKPLSQIQVDSTNAILTACKKQGVTDIHQIVYIVATAYHESRLTPAEEYGKGAEHDYGKKLDMGGGHGKRTPYVTPNALFYGRGFVQLTWLTNYRTFGKLLSVDLVNHPELALSVDIAAEIIVVGMKKGMFTGVSLSKFFTETINDQFSARKIVNGLDCATLIAEYYNHLLEGLSN